jgi:hypothetical protein
MTESEPLVDVLLRVWSDIDTVRDADPDELEAAKRLAFERLELDGIARRADQDQMEVEIRDTLARRDDLRRRLGRGEGTEP